MIIDSDIQPPYGLWTARGGTRSVSLPKASVTGMPTASDGIVRFNAQAAVAVVSVVLIGTDRACGIHAGTGNNPGNGHVLCHPRAVDLFVPAMIRCDNDQCAVSQPTLIESSQQGTDGLVRAADDTQLFRREPTVFMTHAVCGRKWTKAKTEAFFEDGAQLARRWTTSRSLIHS